MAEVVDLIDEKWGEILPVRDPETVRIEYEFTDKRGQLHAGYLSDLVSKKFEELSTSLETFLFSIITLYPFGERISQITGKTNDGDTEVRSCEDFETLKQAIGAIIKMGPEQFTLYLNTYSQPTPYQISKTKDFYKGSGKKGDNKIAVFYLSRHNSYSKLVFYQVADVLTFPQCPLLKTLPSYHHSMLASDANDTLDTSLRAMIESFVGNPKFNPAFQRYKTLAMQFLHLIANQTMAKTKHSEKCRRTLIDIFVYCALGIFNDISPHRREVCVGETLFTEPSSTSSEIIGSGPLDYVLPEGFILSQHDEFVEEEEAEINEEAKEEEEEEEAEKAFVFDGEAKEKFEDKNLYQLLGQLHDSMYVSYESGGMVRKSNQEEGTHKLKLAKKKVVGILTTGHRWEVYTITHDERTRENQVRFIGRRTVKVVRYPSSLFYVHSGAVTATIEKQEVSGILCLLLAVLHGDV